MSKKYTVRYERDKDSGWWIATVPAVRGCLTQGKSIQQARTRIREALSLFVDNADSAILVDDFVLPGPIENQVSAAKAVKEELKIAEARYQQTASTAINSLVRKFGLSARDAAVVMGLSHQRINQVVSKSKRKSVG